MKIKKTSYPPVTIGVSFMLVIFLILSMVIFAVLSFSTAQKDYNYSQKYAALTTEYYTASAKAEEKLAEIDQEIKNGEITESTIEFTVPINDSKILQVVLKVHPEQSDRYTITTWKQITTTTWEGDESLPVLGSK